MDGALQDAIDAKSFEIAKTLFTRVVTDQLRSSMTEPPKLHSLFQGKPPADTQNFVKFLELVLAHKDFW